jgi:signal transduction histidine kinase
MGVIESLFRETVDDKYVESLWAIGKQHVERNVEPRLMILGFSITRLYIHEIVRTRIPLDKSSEIAETINKLLDLCLYVMTAPYIETTTRFDIELIRGIADKIRNPVTVIGGNIRRLKRKAGQNGTSESSVYDTLLQENEKIEQIVRDAKIYLELFEEDPSFMIIPIADLVNTVLGKLLAETSSKNLKIDIQADSTLPYIKGDPKHIEHVFRCVLKNSLEAADGAAPLISVRTTPDKETSHYLKIEIFNTGVPPKEEHIEKIFAPFFSTKTTGTGFGLPIAQLALRKNYGQMNIRSLPQQGTLVVISLPLPEFCDYPVVPA